MNTTDLIGRKFGKLTVIKFDRVEHIRDSKGKNRDKGYWLCKCDCGNQVILARNDIVTGKTKSCGCLYKENGRKTAVRNFKDLTGNRFGKLVVLRLEKIEQKALRNGKYSNKSYWRCKCDCGNEVVVKSSSLKDGRVKSCEDAIRNATKSYTQIGNELKKEHILKEGTSLDNLSGKLSKANTSGVRGVSFNKDKNKFKATIGFKGKKHFLGYYDDIEDARKARERAEEEFYTPILEKYNYKKKEDEEELE